MIETRQIELIPIGKLKPNPDNPKKPMRAKESAGLKASLRKYGFAAVLVVAPDPDGCYEVLNGNSRLEELITAKVQTVPCIVLHELTTREQRNEFVLTHDRHHKVYDEERVIEQLRQLAQAGRDIRELQLTSGVDNLKQILAQRQTELVEQQNAKNLKPMKTMVLHGPTEYIDLIQDVLDTMKKRMSTVVKIAEILVQAESNIDLNDDVFATILLSTITRYEQALS